MPADCSISGLPMPDSSRRCGDFTAPAQNHLAVATRLPRLSTLHIGNPDGALAVEEDARGERLGFDAQIGAGPRRIQKRARRRPTAAILLRCLEIAETFLVAVVVVRIAREPLRHCRLDERIG
jgi:hypothetical protein